MVRLHSRIRMPERRDISIKQVFCYSQVLISLFAAYINDFPFSFVNRLSLIIYQFHFRNASNTLTKAKTNGMNLVVTPQLTV